MNNFLRTFIAFVIYKIITEVAGISYNFLNEPFNLMALLIDLALFIVVFYVVWWITGKTRLGREASET